MGIRVRRLSEQRLLRSGVRALNTRALDGIRRVLGPDALEAASTEGGRATVSRHSAYRLWPQRDKAVVDVARHILDVDEFSRNGLTSAIEAYAKAIEDHVENHQSASGLEKEQHREVFQQVLRADFSVQLRSPGRMAAWLLQVSAMTCSPVWKGSHPDGASQELGREILAVRARFNEAAIDEWAVLLRGAMALFGRRPRRDASVREIVRLMYCMFDGSFLRLFVDSGLNDAPEGEREVRLQQAITRACDAMFEIAWAYSEPGLLADPRRPEESGDPWAGRFDRIVSLAAASYEHLPPGQVVDPEVAATDAGQSTEVGLGFFPTPGDLADSVLRSLVGPQEGEPGEWTVEDAAPWITSTLEVLSDTATSHPAVVAASVATPPTHPSEATSFIAELTQTIGGLLEGSRSLRSDNPYVEATHLVELALKGESGWWGAQAVLERAADRANAP